MASAQGLEPEFLCGAFMIWVGDSDATQIVPASRLPQHLLRTLPFGDGQRHRIFLPFYSYEVDFHAHRKLSVEVHNPCTGSSSRTWVSQSHFTDMAIAVEYRVVVRRGL
jgi:hypothetical protein